MRAKLSRGNVLCRLVSLFLFTVLIFLLLFNLFQSRDMLRHLFLVVTTFFVSAQSVCDIPPSQWCRDVTSAAKCRVTDQCVEWINYISRRPSLAKLAYKRTLSPIFSEQKALAKPVDLVVYFESLCPDCTRFFRAQLGPAFDRLASTGILNLTLVPYGNANEKRNATGLWEFSCQHGEPECRGNILQTCSIHLLKYPSYYFPFIRCMMAKIEDGETPDSSAKLCAPKSKIDYDELDRCASGALGNRLEHLMAVKTDRLIPKKQYVPWVTVFGVHNESMEQEAESNLVKLICDSYQGQSKPAVCHSAERNEPNKHL